MDFSADPIESGREWCQNAANHNLINTDVPKYGRDNDDRSSTTNTGLRGSAHLREDYSDNFDPEDDASAYGHGREPAYNGYDKEPEFGNFEKEPPYDYNNDGY